MFKNLTYQRSLRCQVERWKRRGRGKSLCQGGSASGSVRDFFVSGNLCVRRGGKPYLKSCESSVGIWNFLWLWKVVYMVITKIAWIVRKVYYTARRKLDENKNKDWITYALGGSTWLPQSDKTTKAIWEVTRAGIKIPYNQIYPFVGCWSFYDCSRFEEK